MRGLSLQLRSKLSASLVVLLGYTQTFTSTPAVAGQRYEVSGGAVFGFRQETGRNGEFSLYNIPPRHPR